MEYNIKDFLVDKIKSHGDASFCLCQKDEKDSIFTFSDLMRDTCKFMSLYDTIPDDGNVGLWAETRYETIVAIYASFLKGRFIAIIDGSLPWESARVLMQRADVKTVISGNNGLNSDEYCKDESVRKVPLDSFRNYEPLPVEQIPDNDMKKPTFMLYTSGTTGNSKGVVLSFYSLFMSADGTVDIFGTKKKVLLSILPCYHIYFFIQLGHVLMTGSQIIFSQGVASILDEMKKYQPTMMFVVPAILNNIYEIAKRIVNGETEKVPGVLKQLTGGNMNIMVTGGASIDDDIFRYYEKAGIAIIEGYGMTEIGGALASNRPGSIKRGSVGEMSPYQQFKIVDGEILTKSEVLFLGYYNDPEETQKAFVDGWFATGDLGYTEGIYLFVTGRKKNLIILENGENVSPEELEGLLLKTAEIDEALVRQEENSICAEVYSHLYGTVENSELVDRINQDVEDINAKLPLYKRIARIRIRKTPLIKNQIGKIVRDAVGGPDDFVEIENGNEEIGQVENLIIACFAEVLNQKEVGLYDNFFALGGNSLRATRLAALIEDRLDCEIELREIFATPTSKGLAEIVKNRMGNGHVTDVIPVAQFKEYYPMSPNQEGMYFAWLINKNSLAYNLPVMIKLRKDSSVKDTVEKAFKMMVERHEILRTKFLRIDGKCMQVIVKTEDIFIDYCYVQDTNTDEENLKRSFIRPFDLERANSVRAMLIERSEEYILLLDMHHIVSDGFSYNLFLQEFGSLLNGKLLENQARQYKDYSEWLLERDISKQREYWLKHFEDQIPVLELPCDYERPKVLGPKGQEIRRKIDQKIWDGIQSYAIENGTSEYMILLAGMMILLSELSGQEDIVVGSPINGRSNKDTTSMMGIFINTLPMRCKPEKKKNFKLFLEEVKEECLNAYSNCDYPFEEMTKEIVKKRDYSHNPLYDVLLILQNNEKVNWEKISNVIDASEIGLSSSKCDLEFEITDWNEEHEIKLLYCSELFCEETSEKILNKYIDLLKKIPENEEKRIEDFIGC